MNRIKFLSAVTLGICLSLFATIGCKKTDLTLSTTSDVNITGYLDEHLDSFSLFRQILERTETSAFLNAYGSYTLFAPTNSGVKAWLAKRNAASVDAVDVAVLKDLVKFHLLNDTITTAAFKDGKLPVTTMHGQYLVTGVGIDTKGASSFLINRQAFVTKSNIKVGNGMIHQIDQVLTPASLSIAKELEANAQYSIFVEALKQTGFYTKLDFVDPDTTKRWLTVIAESNTALNAKGFTNFQDLKTKYSKTGNPASPSDSLYMYVAYHILPGIKFLGDIITTSAHQTLQPQEVINVLLDSTQNVIVNEVVFNGVTEKGVALSRPKSDNAATNGVWHDATAHYMLKFRKPQALFWDVSTFAEILKLPAYYKRASYTWTRQSESDQPFKEITWGWGPLAGTNVFTYSFSTTSSTTRYSVNNDVNQLPLGLPNRPIWWEMTTPPIVKGKYKIWMCYTMSKQSSGSNQLCQVSVNGDLLSNTFNFTVIRPKGTDPELEAIGFKRYTDPSRTYSSDSNYVGKMVGIYEFKTTQKQTLRIIPIGGGTQNNNFLDMVHFIPIDDDQLWPKFKTDGSQIQKP